MPAQYEVGKYVYRAGTPTTDTAVAGVMDANGDIQIIDCQDLINMSLMVNQLVDAGTCTLVVEKSMDGVNWASANANLSEASFPAGNNEAKEIALSDANGMPLVAKQLRVTLSAVAGGGSYSIGVAGIQRANYK